MALSFYFSYSIYLNETPSYNFAMNFLYMIFLIILPLKVIVLAILVYKNTKRFGFIDGLKDLKKILLIFFLTLVVLSIEYKMFNVFVLD